MSIQKNYQYNNLVVRVEVSEPNHHTWLQEFLCPHFEIVAQDNYDCHIKIKENDSEYSQVLQKFATCNNHLIDCFIMDSKVISFPSCEINNHQLVIYNERDQLFFLVSYEPQEITLLTQLNNQKIRIFLMRIIRELAMNHCQGNNGLFLHGSAFSINGKGIIIAGEKGVGKTTLLIYALGHKLSSYLSNDRVWVSLINEEIVFRGMPTIAAILPSTLELFPDLRQRLLSSYFDSYLTQNEAKQLSIIPKPRRNGKYSLSPAQLCNLLQVLPVAEAQGWAIIFPKITHQRGNIELYKLSPIAATKKLASALLGSYSLKEQASVFTIPDTKIILNQETRNTLCENIATRVPCYECQVGTDVYKNDNYTNDFINFFFQ